MLVSFSVENFRSILSLNMDLAYAEGKAPNSYRLSPVHVFFEKNKMRVVPCLAIFGANASGKTNFVKSLTNLQILLKKNIEDVYHPNLIHKNYNPTKYSISFFVDNDLYIYSIYFTGSEISYESLSINGEVHFTIEDRQLISYKSSWESYPMKKLNDILKVECSINTSDGYIQQKSFLSIIYKNYQGLDNVINRAFEFIDSLLVYFPGSLPSIEVLLSYANKNSKIYNENKLLPETAKILKKFDFDIELLTYKERIFETQNDFIKFVMSDPNSFNEGCNFEEKRLRVLYAVHRDIYGDNVEFKLSEESSGTQTLVKLIMIMLISLERGSPLVIDEIDRAIHPFILNCILDIYKDKQYNSNNSQLIFTTHTTDILENNNIRVSEIGLIDKTKKYGTILKRASDFKEIRNVHNFRNLYCSGKLSAIPFPYI